MRYCEQHMILIPDLGFFQLIGGENKMFEFVIHRNSCLVPKFDGNCDLGLWMDPSNGSVLRPYPILEYMEGLKLKRAV